KTTLTVLPALLPAEVYYWKRVRHALFVSNAVRNEVMGAYEPRLRTAATVLNGLSLDDLPPIGDEPSDAAPILFTGRLLGWKGLSVRFRALTELRGGQRLDVTGSGAVETWRRHAQSLGLGPDRVRLLGVIPRTELLARLRRASVVVVPSFMESCPYSLIEAMAFGKPIVASNVPGVTDMVSDGKSALLVPPGDPHALAGALQRILSDESLARRLGAAAGQQARDRFSLDRMSNETSRAPSRSRWSWPSLEDNSISRSLAASGEPTRNPLTPSTTASSDPGMSVVRIGMPIARDSSHARGGAAVDRASWIGDRKTSAAKRAAWKASADPNTRRPGRSEAWKDSLKCSGLKQKRKANFEGSRSRTKFAVFSAAWKSSSVVCWMKPVQKLTRVSCESPSSFLAVSRAAAVGGEKRSVSIPHRIIRTRSVRYRSSIRRRW